MRKKITFITNIPSPYNLNLFQSLASGTALDVYFYNDIESERQWNLDIKNADYRTAVFKKDFFHRFFQKINRNFYFNWQCVSFAFSAQSDYFILGGNYFAPNTFILLFILRLRNQKIAWYGEKLLPTHSRVKKIIKRLLISPVNGCTNLLFAVGEGASALYRAYGYRKEIFITPYAIDNTPFTREPKQYGNTENSKLIFLSSGSLIHRKGYDIAITAFNLLNAELKKNIEYWILGDGPEREALEKLVHKDLTVHFMGFIEPAEVPAYFAKASFFLISSRYDGWGVVVNEAIAAGLPLIATNTCGAAEYVDANGGFVVPCEAEAISKVIRHLILNPAIAQAFSIHNSDKAESISSDSIAKKMIDALNTNTIK